MAENRIALFLRLTSAILGVTITLANILTQISKQGTTLTTPQSAPGRSSTGYANLQIARVNFRDVCNHKCKIVRRELCLLSPTARRQSKVSQALANSRELCVKSASAKPVEQQWKTCGSRQKLARRGIYLIAAPKNAERVGVYGPVTLRNGLNRAVSFWSIPLLRIRFLQHAFRAIIQD